ncbi:MAG: tryptophan-rich sensory protein [Patescibacteria group bacterium]|nr:tryptophan-rich sensory protein [Patescibacteria group bacterium]
MGRKKGFFYILIPLIAVMTALIGGYYTNKGLGDWYQKLKKPSWTPPGNFIGLVWTIIYTLTSISAIFVLRKAKREEKPKLAFLYLLNAFLNAFWSYLFFYRHKIRSASAFLEANALNLSVLSIIKTDWKISPVASLLLIPYALWVSFATFLTYKIEELNRKR